MVTWGLYTHLKATNNEQMRMWHIDKGTNQNMTHERGESHDKQKQEPWLWKLQHKRRENIMPPPPKDGSSPNSRSTKNLNKESSWVEEQRMKGQAHEAQELDLDNDMVSACTIKQWWTWALEHWGYCPPSKNL